MAKKKIEKPVTRADVRAEIQAALKNHPTKKDLARYATRTDVRTDIEAALKNHATKKDLERYATKKDLERYATKVDLAKAVENLVTKEMFLKLATQVFQIRQEMTDLRAIVLTKADGDRIMSALDHLMTQYDNHTRKALVHDERLRLLEERCPAAGVGGT